MPILVIVLSLLFTYLNILNNRAKSQYVVVPRGSLNVKYSTGHASHIEQSVVEQPLDVVAFRFEHIPPGAREY